MAEVSMKPKAKIKVQVAKFRGDITELPEDYTQHPDFLGFEEIEIDPEELTDE